MSLFTFKRIPLSFDKISTRVNLHDMTLLPFVMVMAVMFNVCMSLSLMEMQTLSYLILAIDLGGFFFMFSLLVYKREMSSYGFCFFLFMILLIIFSLINDTDVKDATYTAMSTWLILLLMRYYRNRMNMLIGCFAIALSVCVWANFLHLIYNPNLWMVDNEKFGYGYLLGDNYNQMGCRLMIALMSNMLCIKHSRLWLINFIVIAILSIVSLTMVGSMTSLSMIVVFLFFCLIPSSRLRKLFMAGLFFIWLLFQVFVVFSGKGLENNELAVFLVEDVLKKDITFTHRTYMWDCALNVIEKSPIWGWGNVDNDWFKSKMTSFATGPHNFILYVLITGGIILLLLYIAICVKAFKSIRPYLDERMAQTILFSVITLMVMALMEIYPFPIMFYAISLVFYYPYIARNPKTCS